MEQLRDKVTSVVAVCLGVLIMFVLGTGLWAQRSYFPYVGGAFLIDVFIFLALAPFAVFFFLFAYFNRGQYIANEPHGGYLRTVLGKLIPLPPLTPIAPKLAGARDIAQVQAPAIPRLGELIREGTLVKEDEGELLMFQGFRADGTIRYGKWAGVIGVAGMQNVGKSVTIEALAIIALLQYAKVIVCDTHHTKARSLYKKLQCLEGFITFARNEEQVLAEAQNFSQELKNRKNGSEPYPYVLVIDEAASLVRSKVGDELVTVVEEGSQEGQGYNLHLVLAIHDFSKDGLGDARIRDFLNFIYCHRMQAGQTKFIEAFKGRLGKERIAAIIASLLEGHAITKDEVNTVEYLIMPYGDSKDALLARKYIEDSRAFPRGFTPALVQRPQGREQIAERATTIASAQSNVIYMGTSQGEQKQSISEDETNGFGRAETNGFVEPGRVLSLPPSPETQDFNSYQGRKEEVRRLLGLNFRQAGIIYKIWGARPGETQAYKDALAEYKHILEEV